MGYLFTYIILVCVVAFLGDQRTIGSFNAFFISLFLSPIVGLVVVLSSKRKDTIKFEQELLQTHKSSKEDYVNKLYKLHSLFESGVITNEIYEEEKALLNSNRSIMNEEKSGVSVFFYDSKNRQFRLKTKGMSEFKHIPDGGVDYLEVTNSSKYVEGYIDSNALRDIKFSIDLNLYGGNKIDIADLI